MTRTVGSGNDISIHSLRMEGDIKETPKTSMKSFQSTPSAWRETIGVVETVTPIWDFNPLPPHGGRRIFHDVIFNDKIISIHSLRMEGDAYCGAIRRTRKRISIHSLRMEGDNDFGYNLISDNISIHSLRMEGDDTHSGKNRQKTYFNPLPPHGGRRISSYHSGILRAFQSTPSAWRETSLFSKHFTNVHISIHSLRMEGDTIPENDLASVVISIHSLRMEGDCG